MEKIYDDKWYKSIKKLIYTQKYESALQFLSEDLIKYPYDNVASNIYLELLFVCGKLEEIPLYLNILSDDFNQDMAYIKKYFEIKSLIYSSEYEKILIEIDKLQEASNPLIKKAIVGIYLYAKCKLGLIDKNNINVAYQSYTNLQVIDYSNDRLMEHIKKHDCDGILINDKIFKYNNLDIDKFVNDISEYIDISKVNHSIAFCDYYIFRKRCVGISRNGITTDYLKVVVIPQDNKIITIYPISSIEIRKSDKIIDLELLNLESIGACSNKFSRIEKFNQKLKKCKKI